ncbi:hypothetical protein [Janibacter sp. Soil728]|uniref:hypothetical protein n=1 Tax=Janibacter sp. Soil728 TaxID=1736393 RepID=UPI0012E957C0|nr:hypothetical protein [Janibacter sp. Soil728]
MAGSGESGVAGVTGGTPGRRAVLVGGVAVLGVAAGARWLAGEAGVRGSDGVKVSAPTGPVIAGGDPSASALAASKALFVSAHAAVVVAPGTAGEDLESATLLATQAGVPCLVDGDGLAEELDRLGCERLIRRGPVGDAPQWSDAVTDRDEVETLPALTRTPHPVVVVTPDPDAHAAAIATVHSALGSSEAVHVLRSADPRADHVVATLRADPPRPLVIVGDSPGLPTTALAGAARMATTAPELPGGGVLPFPGRRMIALYGFPGVPGLGLLGEQDVDAAIERAQDLAKEYAELVEERVVPAFEIIVTVADSSAGADGDYSRESDPEVLRPWVDAAGKAGVYVVLDLQPGRADFLSQAKRYTSLLTEPHVGLALDPEWRIGPHERPLQRIGHVEADEVNEVAAWLAELTRDHDLPQKVFTLHQFQLQMLRDRDRIRTDLPELAVVVHVDGHGTPGLKQETWAAIREDLPDGMRLGWKNFIDEDTPTLTPEATVRDVSPVPWFVSYQ